MVSYYYLVSSLPMLFFGAKPPFSFEGFLDKCRDFISLRDMDVLEGISLQSDGIKNERFALVGRWRDFERDLRNELVKIRAHRMHIDADKYLRQPGYVSLQTVQALTAVSRIPSMLDSEKALDQLRWDFLEESGQGHYFDLEFLVVYGLKLRLLEKWQRIDTADKAGLLAEVLTREYNVR